MKILLTGKDGQLGRALSKELKRHYDLSCFGRTFCDITDLEMVKRIVRTVNPDVIINAAGYTAVDDAEYDTEECFSINAAGPDNLAKVANQFDAALIHYSTDYIFDGRKDTPYSERDIPSPLNSYGHSKLEGERRIREQKTPGFIIRTGWIYSDHGQSFVNKILVQLKSEKSFGVVYDQIGNPTSAKYIARTTSNLVSAMPKIILNRGTTTELLNVVCCGQASWYDFATEIRRVAAQIDRHYGDCSINRITASEISRPAARPAYSCLSTSRLKKLHGISSPDWKTEFKSVFRSISV